MKANVFTRCVIRAASLVCAGLVGFFVGIICAFHWIYGTGFVETVRAFLRGFDE